MLRHFKINIAQLLCLTAIAGSILHLSFVGREEPFWRDDFLHCEQPNVPRPFELITKKTIEFKASLPSGAELATYPDSTTLYLENHRRGWERIRKIFYENKDWMMEYDSFDFYEDYDYSKLSFRGAEELIFLAQWEGRQGCREQLFLLLEVHDEHELRGKIAYSHYWALLPPLSICALAVLVLAIYCPLDWKAAV